MTTRATTALVLAMLVLGGVVGVVAVAAFGLGIPAASQPSGAASPSAMAAAASPSPSPSADAPSPSASPAPSASGPAPSASAPSGAIASPTPPPTTGPQTRLVPVLMYHRIGDPPSTAPYPALYVAKADFDAQMHALHDAGWHTITAGALGAAIAKGRTVPVRTFVVMFDDGYEDNFTAAFPILKRYGFVATFSVVASGGSSMMTSPQLAILVRSGMEIGNHTMNHRNVSRLSGDLLVQQIDGAAHRIETRLAAEGVPKYLTRTFVYPSGHVGPAALALLAQLGYTDAFTEVYGVAVIGTSQPLQLPRLRVSRFLTLAQFLAMMPSGPNA